jgi:predicted metal-dependent phosphoesterase TrpH
LIDLHTHTTASDGTLAPAALVAAAQSAGLIVLGITDHDTTAGYLDARDVAARAGLTLVAGLEISAVADGRDVHMLGYFVDPVSVVLTDFLQRQRADRIRRVTEMADRLAGLGYPIDSAPIIEAAARGRSVGRPQIAMALRARGHVASHGEAFERFLEHGRPAYVPRLGATPHEVIEIVHAAGGIAGLAHPGITGRDDLLAPLVDAGLDAIEVCHSDHDASTEARYRRAAADLGVLVCGGSDFHGDNGHRSAALGVVTLPLVDYERLRDRAAARGRH